MRVYIIFALILVLFTRSAIAQTPSTSQNFVMETKVKVPEKTTIAHLNNLPVAQANRTINYMDGLGRPLQTVDWQGSPLGKDLVQVKAYDAFGRENKQYLPYAEQSANDGTYKSSGLNTQSIFYGSGWDANIPKTPYPFSRTIFEASPLNRVLEQGAPGLAWQPSSSRTTSGRTQAMSYGTNTSEDDVRLWVAATSGASGTGSYALGKLYKTIAKDENWTSGNIGTTEEFKDFEGKVVLKRVWEAEGALSTYYIYDDLGNLRYVIPPAVSATSFVESDTIFKDFIYGYHYDGRKRVYKKHVPGKGWEEMVYNDLDQLVMSRDANQEATYKWSFNKYDIWGRVIISGVISNANTRVNWESLVNAQGAISWETLDNANYTGTGYTSQRQPAIILADCNVITYYDSYGFNGNSTTYAASGWQSVKIKGLTTASKVKILGTSNFLLSVYYYDNEARVIETVADHHLLGTDRTVNTYSFAGQLKTSTRIHKVGANTTTIANVYDYDHVGRKLTTKQKINSQPEVVLSKNDYNEVGQLKQKHLHSTNGTTYAQNTKYAYNERGWLKNSASTEFSMKLGYDTLANPQYNGNIRAQLWGKGITYPNQFLYQYDGLNRLTNGTSTGIVMSEAITYDVMGNIKTLSRGGNGATLTGTYNYTGNKLSNISGSGLATGAYVYDANGNATTDGRTGVTLTYNYLNLPVTATRSGLNLAYTYDARGKKLKRVSNGTTTHYVDGIQYNGSIIDFIQTEEGIAKNNGGTYIYQYNLSDHLGNVRYSFDIYQGVKNRIQEDDYYAFGLRKSVIPVVVTNNYLYNGKELQDELGQYDYGARFYDPYIGRWNSIDPLAEKMMNWSPYTYAFNNPIRFIDIGGMIPYPITIRGFAPYSTFGFGFHGDGRGYSTNANMTARVHQRINFDTDKTSMTTQAWSSPSFRSGNPRDAEAAIPSVNFTGDLSISNNGDARTFGFGTHVAAANPKTPSWSPNIDIFSDFSITENKKAGTLSISGKLTGDNFPSTEAFITDPSGNNLFIGVGQIGEGVGKNTGPFTELRGENQRPITGFNFSITTDKKGNFTGVKKGKTTYSIEDWNKLFTSKPTQQQ